VARGGIEPPTQGFSTLKIIVFDSRNIAEPCRQTFCPIRTETLGFERNGLGLGGLDSGLYQRIKPLGDSGAFPYTTLGQWPPFQQWYPFDFLFERNIQVVDSTSLDQSNN